MKRKCLGKLIFGFGVGLIVSLGGFVLASEANAADMHRLYNPNSGEHFYTANLTEKNNVQKAGWRYEGIGWNAPASGNPVYRLYNPNAGDHHYTLNANERDNLKRHGWRYEGVSWHSPNSGKPLYRLYNPNAKAGSHHYTLNANERDNLKRVGWRYEGIAWYAVDGNSSSGNNGGGTTTPPPTPSFDVTTVEKQISQQLFTKINQHRTSIGLKALDSSSILNTAVATRANDLYTLYDHKRPDGTDISTYVNIQLGYNKYGSCGGENIWGGTYKTDRDNPEAVSNLIINGWKGSSGHRKLLESNIANEGAVGIKLKHRGTTYYDISVVFLTGINSSK